MQYTSTQIENAKKQYNIFLTYQTAKDQSCYESNPHEAERRSDGHNKIVRSINEGDKSLEKEWKMFFLREEVKADRKEIERKDKLAANKNASADILEPIKSIKKLGEFGKWLNTRGNPFRKEHFNKKYTTESVNTFLSKI